MRQDFPSAQTANTPSTNQADLSAGTTAPADGATSSSTRYCPLFSKDNALLADRCNYEYAVSQPCNPGTVTEIDTTLRNFFTTLKGIQEYGDLYVNGTLGEASNLTYEISKTVSIISGVLRTFTQRLRNFIMNLIKELIQGAVQCLLTPLLDSIKDTVFGVVLDQLMCKFDEIMGNLKDFVSDFLFALVNLQINNPTFCAIEAFTNALLNNLANEIDSAIAPVLAEIQDLLGGAAQVVGSVFSVINQVLAYEGLLCSEPKCPKDVQKFKTGPFGGPSKGETEDFNDFIGSPSAGLAGFNQSAEDWLNENFPADSNTSGSDCYTGPYECGSPQIVIFGGGGSGASANAVVNGIGQIIGFNLLSPGTGYSSAPFVSIVDPAGCGGGAQAYAILCDDSDEVCEIVLTDPGSGYSQTDNGGSPVINQFYGSPNPVQVGNSITLNWDVSNFTSISLATGGNSLAGYGNISEGSSQASFVINTSDVLFAAGSDSTTKTYTLTATKTNDNSSSQTVSRDYTFTVTKSNADSTTEEDDDPNVNTAFPTIDSFTGSPSVGTVLTPGSILTLSWETTNATTVTLNPEPTTTNTIPVDGSISYTMPTNITSGILTSYTLTATNVNASSEQQSISQTITYTVSPNASDTQDSSEDNVASAPVINSFTGSPGIGTVLSPGAIVTLSWETTNATSVVLSPAPTTTTTLSVDGSATVVAPSNITSGVTTTFTLIATNSNAPVGIRTVTQDLTYTVSPTVITADGGGGDQTGIGTTGGNGSGIGDGGDVDGDVVDDEGEDQGGGNNASTGTNSAVACLSRIIVLEGGINYQSTDQVNIVGGNNGAEFELVTTALGQIVAINILTTGCGFVSIPKIEINSLNGVGAKFLPQLNFTPLDKFLADQDLESLDPAKLVQVVDCVYK